MAPTKLASVSVSRGDVSEFHDRRAYTPPNAEVTFADANAVLYDVGDFRGAVNDEMRSAIADYNARRAAAGDAKHAEIEAFNADAKKQNEAHAGDEGWTPIRPKRFKPEKYSGKSYDYYNTVQNSDYKNGQQPVLEYVIQFGRAETHGVCDDPFNDEEYAEAKRLDETDGGTRAEEYERTHFDYGAWEDLKAKDPAAASEYAQAHRASGGKKIRHDEARQMALELGQRISAHPERFLPPGAKLLMVVLHDDEPGGTPHLHVAFAPFASGYKGGLEKRISLSRCFHDAGYKGAEYMKTWQNEIKGEMCAVMRDHGYQREHMQNEEAHLAPSEMREKRRGERARRLAERIEAELHEKSAELTQVESDLEAAKTDLEFARMSTSAVREDAAAAEREQASAEAEARRAEARAEIHEHGYTPPWYARALVEGVDYEATDEMAEIIDKLEDGDDDTSLGDRYLDLVAEQVGDARGARALMYAGYGENIVLWWLDPEAEPVDETFADAASELNELTDLALDAGIDPTEPYQGLEEREADLAEREDTVETREQTIAEREQAVTQREQRAAKREDNVFTREQQVRNRENVATSREQAVAARERRAATAEASAKQRAEAAYAETIAEKKAEAARLDSDIAGKRSELTGLDADLAAARQLIAGARQTAEGILAKARAEAARLVDQARATARQVVREVFPQFVARVAQDLVRDYRTKDAGYQLGEDFQTLTDYVGTGHGGEVVDQLVDETSRHIAERSARGVVVQAGVARATPSRADDALAVAHGLDHGHEGMGL